MAAASILSTIADESRSYPNKGYVHRYIEPGHLNGGDVDAVRRLCSFRQPRPGSPPSRLSLTWSGANVS